jgi:hypothetical protein
VGDHEIVAPLDWDPECRPSFRGGEACEAKDIRPRWAGKSGGVLRPTRLEDEVVARTMRD